MALQSFSSLCCCLPSSLCSTPSSPLAVSPKCQWFSCLRAFALALPPPRKLCPQIAPCLTPSTSLGLSSNTTFQWSLTWPPNLKLELCTPSTKHCLPFLPDSPLKHLSPFNLLIYVFGLFIFCFPSFLLECGLPEGTDMYLFCAFMFPQWISKCLLNEWIR